MVISQEFASVQYESEFRTSVGHFQYTHLVVKLPWKWESHDNTIIVKVLYTHEDYVREGKQKCNITFTAYTDYHNGDMITLCYRIITHMVTCGQDSYQPGT